MFFFFSSRRRHTRFDCDWSSDVCSSDLGLYAALVTFRIMGSNYDAAVLAAGHCGFGMGATPTAVANMQAITNQYGPSHKAFRSEEHTSELQSQSNLVCRLLLEKKKKNKQILIPRYTA